MINVEVEAAENLHAFEKSSPAAGPPSLNCWDYKVCTVVRFNAAKSMEMLYKAPPPSQVDASGHNFIILHVHERTWGGVNVLILMIWWAKASHEQKIFSPKGLQLTLYSQLSV